MTWIQTLSGSRFDLQEPDPSTITPHDLAMCLARKCRFGGHCREFYSVAQHSVLVCDLTPDPSLKLPALLHDAHEAYSGFGDVLRPAKWLSPAVGDFLSAHTANIDKAISRRFGIPLAAMHHPAVKHNDNVALATEARDLMEEPPCPWESLPPPRSKIILPMSITGSYELFMDRLSDLWSEQATA